MEKLEQQQIDVDWKRLGLGLGFLFESVEGGRRSAGIWRNVEGSSGKLKMWETLAEPPSGFGVENWRWLEESLYGRGGAKF